MSENNIIYINLLKIFTLQNQIMVINLPKLHHNEITPTCLIIYMSNNVTSYLIPLYEYNLFL